MYDEKKRSKLMFLPYKTVYCLLQKEVLKLNRSFKKITHQFILQSAQKAG